VASAGPYAKYLTHNNSVKALKAISSICVRHLVTNVGEVCLNANKVRLEGHRYNKTGIND